MKFKLKNQAYTHVIFELRKASLGLVDQTAVKNCINLIKIAIENHEQDPAVVSGYIKDVLSHTEFDEKSKLILENLATDLMKSYAEDSKLKFENPLARRLESELSIELLTNPTSATMRVVDVISLQIIKLLLANRAHIAVKNFLDILPTSASPIGLGGFEDKPSLDEVIKVLANGRDIEKLLSIEDPTMLNEDSKVQSEIEKIPQRDSEDLAAIMHLHFKFGQAVFRNIPITVAPRRSPTGKFKDLVQEVWAGRGDLANFFSIGIAQTTDNSRFLRSFISDNEFYSSTLYTQERSRGRDGKQDYNMRSNQLGLMLPNQKQYEEGLPKHKTFWSPDCKSQDVDPHSKYVRDLIENDAVYIVGPSGMVSVFISQMELLGNFQHINPKLEYLTAVFGYMGAGGYHSLHETIGPAEYVLNYIPGYHVQVPGKEIALPPNYNVFFKQQASIDPEFEVKRDTAWDRYLAFYEHCYLPKNNPHDEKEDEVFYTKNIINSPPLKFFRTSTNKVDEILIDIYLSFISILVNYIKSNGTPNTNAKFFKEVPTHEKNLVAQMIERLENNYFNNKLHYESFRVLLNVSRDVLFKLQLKKSRSEFTQSGLEVCFDKLDKMLDHYDRMSVFSQKKL